MDEIINSGKVEFNKILGIKNDVNNLFVTVKDRIHKIKCVYNQYIKLVHTKSFIFGMDSFYFQTELLVMEYKNMTEYYNQIINSMYGEYYKLSKEILHYVKKNHITNFTIDNISKKSYPVYRDLESTGNYDFKHILQLHDDILTIVGILIKLWKKKEHGLDNYNQDRNYGINIDNFVNSYKYEMNILEGKIDLYKNCLEFYCRTHSKLLSNLKIKISILVS